MDLIRGLAGHWKLNEVSGTRLDSLGINNLTDNATVTQSEGIQDKAAFFTNANTEWLSCADSIKLSISSTSQIFTIAAWVNGTAFSVDMVIAAQYNVTGNQRSWRLWFNSSVGKFDFTVSADGTSTVTDVTATTFGLPVAGNWNFVMAWFDPDNNLLNISVNNGPVNKVAFISSVFNSSADFTIGSRAGANCWDGAIDEVGFWKRLLSAEEKSFLYNKGKARAFEEFRIGGTYII